MIDIALGQYQYFGHTFIFIAVLEPLTPYLLKEEYVVFFYLFYWFPHYHHRIYFYLMTQQALEPLEYSSDEEVHLVQVVLGEQDCCYRLRLSTYYIIVSSC
jgi:hypothetical protein